MGPAIISCEKFRHRICETRMAERDLRCDEEILFTALWLTEKVCQAVLSTNLHIFLLVPHLEKSFEWQPQT